MKHVGRPTHILVIRLTGLTQTAMCVHALRGLWRDFPDLKITMLTTEALLPLFRDLAGVEFLLADAPRYRSLLGRIRLWRDSLRTGADAIADLENTPRSRRLSRSLTPWRRHTERIDKSRNEKSLMTRKFRKVMVQLQTLSQRSRDVFEHLGLPFCMPAPIRKRRTTPPTLATILAGEKQGSWIGVAPLSHHKGLCYPIPQSARLVELLSQNYTHVFIFGQGKYERLFAEGMEQLHPNVSSVVDKCSSLGELMDLTAAMDAVVTIDGPILSLASLVGTPAISVWGATHPFVESCGYGQNPLYILQEDLPCRPCSLDGRRHCLHGSYECMTRISPELIIGRLRLILSPDK